MSNNLFINKIAIGTVQFGVDYGISNKEGVTTPAEVEKILHYATKKNIDTLDTAFAYGKSEEVLGKFQLHDKKIVSKFPAIKNNSVEYYLDQSLKRLNVSKLYGYIAHSANDIIGNKEIWHQLSEKKQLGIVDKIGYSLYSPAELEILLKDDMKPDLIQIPYNILDRRFEPMFKDLKSMNVEIHTRSTFLQGLFFIPPNELSDFFNPIKSFLHALHEKYIGNKERAAVLLDFCLANQFIDKVVIGVNNLQQLKENTSVIGQKEDLVLLPIPNFPEEILLPNKWPKK